MARTKAALPKYNFDVIGPEIDPKTGFATQNGWIKVYDYNNPNREYSHARYEYIVIGTTQAAQACLDEPPHQPEANQAIIRSADDKSWEFIEDYRGTQVYNKENPKHTDIVSNLGPINPEYTDKVPGFEFSKWDEESDNWIEDEEAKTAYLVMEKKNEQSIRISEATNIIDDIQQKLMFGIYEGDEEVAAKAKAKSWILYREEVKKLDFDADPTAEFPERP